MAASLQLQVVNRCFDTSLRISFASNSPCLFNLRCCKRICIIFIVPLAVFDLLVSFIKSLICVAVPSSSKVKGRE